MSAESKISITSASSSAPVKDAAKNEPIAVPAVVEKEGMIFKRGARMQRWSARYFVLEGHKLCYKAKRDAASFKYQYDLIDGCVVTDIVPDVSSSGSKLYTFWVVWPGAKDSKDAGDIASTAGDNTAEPSAPSLSVTDGPGGAGRETVTNARPPVETHSFSSSLPPSVPTTSGSSSSDSASSHLQQQALKDQCTLKTIVEAERKNRLDVQGKVEQQIEAHHAYDNNTALGVKIAAAAVGGVVVGALTAGIGLIPYVTVVGVTALVSGGAVAAQSVRRPIDSRIILATETLSEALSWKSVIEMQIAKVVEAKRPSLPSLHHITHNTSRHLTQEQLHQFHQNGYWRNIGYLPGGMRVQEHIPSVRVRSRGGPGVLCYKCQMVIPNSPIKTFLALMDLNSKSGGTPPMWPARTRRVIPATDTEVETSENFCKLVEVLDDHADILAISMRVKSTADPSPTGGSCCSMPGAVGSTVTGLDMPDESEERSYDNIPQLIERWPLYLNTTEPTGLHQNFDAEGNVEWDDLKTTYAEQFRLFVAPFRTYQSRDFWGRIQKEMCYRMNGEIASDNRKCKYPLRQFCLHRFWKLDDDGTYLITCTLTAHPEFPSRPAPPPATPTGTFADKSASQPELPITIDTVITISPRKDADLYSEDVNECLVTCSIQASSPEDSSTAAACPRGDGDDISVPVKKPAAVKPGSTDVESTGMTGGGWVDRSECEGFMLEYLYQLIDLKHHIMYAKHTKAMRQSVSSVARDNSFSSAQNQGQYVYSTPSKTRGGSGVYQLETPQSIGSSIMNSVPGTPATPIQAPPVQGRSDVPIAIPMRSKNRFAGTSITTQQPGLDDDEIGGIAYSPAPVAITADALSSHTGAGVGVGAGSTSGAGAGSGGKDSSPASTQSKLFSFRSKKDKDKEKDAIARRDRAGSNLSSTGSVDGGASVASEGGSGGTAQLSEYRERATTANIEPIAEPIASPRGRSASMARRRSSILKRANPELLNLRNSIQGKEYEIHRIEKMLRKLSDQPVAAKTADDGAGNGERESLREFLSQQCKEYHELTQQYYLATQGEEYRPKSSIGKKLVKRGIVTPVVPLPAPSAQPLSEGDGPGLGAGLGIDSNDMAALSGTGLSPSHGGGPPHPTHKTTAVAVKGANRWRNWFGGSGGGGSKELGAHGSSSSSIDTLVTDPHSVDLPLSHVHKGPNGLVLKTSVDNLSVLGHHRGSTDDDDDASVVNDPFFDRVPRCSRSLPKHWNHPLILTHRTMKEDIKFNNHVQADATALVVMALFSLLTMWLIATANQMDWHWQGLMSTD